MTRTTPELTSSLQTSTPYQREDVRPPAYDLTCSRSHTRRFFSRLRFRNPPAEGLPPRPLGCGNKECADQLAKEAISKGDPFFLPKPLSYLKSEIKSAALNIWQDNWDNEETGLSTHDIVPRVSNKPIGWNREEIMFVTGHGPFLSYLHLFNLLTHDNCSCGEKGDPMHYATKC
ncbi:hypothetical protein AVEN_253712-1 [Araneus ventricosus]|uniref:Uncharacterized protein n=1 Tax=Araneus ventricosus TaxID=182803 RepID=A0A4Y2DYM6_ARAVE|nr:hypothetical protein AVEN_253712-1 [Araneus ventricosus]